MTSMVARREAVRPVRVVLASAAAVVYAVYGTAFAFSSLLTGQQHDAKILAKRPAMSRLDGKSIFRRQAPSTAPQSSLLVKPGDRVEVDYEAVWLDCDVVEVSEDGSTCTVLFDDGEEETAVDVATRVRLVADADPIMPLKRGQRVEVFFEGEWYPTTVLKVGEGGVTCTAKYDDGGDEEPDIHVRSRVRPLRIPLSALEIGSKHKGRVVFTAPFGAFVDIGAETDGLVHISSISQKVGERVNDLEKYVSKGQDVDVWVSSISDTGKLLLSAVEGNVGGGGDSRPRRKPKANVASFREYRPDQWITGTVKKFAPYGVFVTVPSPDGLSEADGLVHIAQMQSSGFVDRPQDVVRVGQEVQVRIEQVSAGKLGLSMIPPAALAPFKNLPRGTWLKATVKKFYDFGIYVIVSMPDGSATADGVVHISEIREGYVRNVQDEVEVGQEVDVRIKKLDVDAGDLFLSMKGSGIDISVEDASADISTKGRTAATTSRPTDERRVGTFSQEPTEPAVINLPEGAWLRGRVKNIVPFGAFVTVSTPDGSAAGEGLVHISEMSDGYTADPGNVVAVGQEVAVRVLSAYDGAGFLSLSMRSSGKGEHS